MSDGDCGMNDTNGQDRAGRVGASDGPAITRRSLIGAGLSVGAALLLTGCASGGRRIARLPGVAWPEDGTPTTGDRRRLDLGHEAPRPSAPPTQARSGAVIPRSQWTGARPIRSRMNPPLRSVTKITIHHDGMSPVAIRTRSDAADRLALIHRSHLNRGWGDIGYHYVIDPLGNVWEGRPLHFQGAHVASQNDRNLGILVMGNFEAQSPTGAQLRALDSFVVEQMRRQGVPPARVHTHQELASTLCPGRNLQRYMDRTRSRGGAIAMA